MSPNFRTSSGRSLVLTTPPRCVQRGARSTVHRASCCAASRQHPPNSPPAPDRRQALTALAAALCVPTVVPVGEVWAKDDFITTPSGLKYLDLKVGQGVPPQAGQTCVVQWAGYTSGYQGKRIGNTTVKDEPYTFVLGKHQVGTGVGEDEGSVKPVDKHPCASPHAGHSCV
jgi:hypothetical protein